MVDWGSFALKAAPAEGAMGVDLLSGSASRGLSMARTLGSEDANQVTQPGRKVSHSALPVEHMDHCWPTECSGVAAIV